jgi:hypothetical protein
MIGEAMRPRLRNKLRHSFDWKRLRNKNIKGKL